MQRGVGVRLASAVVRALGVVVRFAGAVAARAGREKSEELQKQRHDWREFTQILCLLQTRLRTVDWKWRSAKPRPRRIALAVHRSCGLGTIVGLVRASRTAKEPWNSATFQQTDAIQGKTRKK